MSRSELLRYGALLALIAIAAAAIAAYLDLDARIDALEAAEPRATTPLAPPPAWSCASALSAGAVRAAIGRQGRTVLACYEERAEPTLRGTLVLRVRVSPTGAVDAVHVRGIEDRALVECAGNAAMQWTFDPPPGGGCAIVEAPFALGPSR